LTTTYFTGINPELLSRIPLGASLVVEVGAGAGNFGAVYRSLNPAARYIGLELNSAAAEQAAARLSHVILGDVETAASLDELDGALEGQGADVLIFGDVLEHLRDPWATLDQLRRRVKPGGVCVACIPNVGHWSLIQQQLQGQWDYTDAGLLDRTHLRFFTLSSAAAMFKSSGWEVVDAFPRVLWPEKTEQAIRAVAPIAPAWGISPEALRRNLSAFQWVIRAVNGTQQPRLNVAGLGLRRIAGVTEARVDYPLSALRGQPGVQVIWAAERLIIPPDWGPGVLVLQRSFLNTAPVVEALESLVARGWLLVSDIDDDPHHVQGYIKSNFRTFRGVHAVTVSTPPLAEMVSQWNPEVAVLPNGVMQLPAIPDQVPKSSRPKVFFGALNRQADWQPLKQALSQAALELQGEVEWSVVHDLAFFEMLPQNAIKRFQGTLAPDAFMQALAECDVALLPLADTPFNRHKSDLKLIESCAAGAVPICSPVVYDAQAEHHEIAVFASSPEDWRAALVKLCRDPSELKQRRAKGRLYVASRRMHGAMSAGREAVYRDWFSRRKELEEQRQARLAIMG
jgi:SAM-dependent methyltransferase